MILFYFEILVNVSFKYYYRFIALLVCSDGFRWQGCKVMCNQVCHSFENQLKHKNMCIYPQKCIGGCVKENQQSTACPVGSMWRDNNTCVSKDDCTCFSRNGTQVKVR